MAIVLDQDISGHGIAGPFSPRNFDLVTVQVLTFGDRAKSLYADDPQWIANFGFIALGNRTTAADQSLQVFWRSRLWINATFSLWTPNPDLVQPQSGTTMAADFIGWHIFGGGTAHIRADAL